MSLDTLTSYPSHPLDSCMFCNATVWIGFAVSLFGICDPLGPVSGCAFDVLGCRLVLASGCCGCVGRICKYRAHLGYFNDQLVE